MAIRKGDWKYHLPHTYKTVVSYGNNGKNGKSEDVELEESLFHLSTDPGEQENVLEGNVEKAAELKANLH